MMDLDRLALQGKFLETDDKVAGAFRSTLLLSLYDAAFFRTQLY